MGCDKVLQEQGYRLTPQRLMVLEAIHSAEGHISAEEIYARVKARYPYANISTIYRTLELLEGLGLVVKTDFGEGYVRYHHAEKGLHHHLICRKCGKLINLTETAVLALKEALLRDYQFKASLGHLAIFGECQECQR